MSHNINEIKSQHELNDGKRTSEVLIKAIEKCERLEKKNKVLQEELKVAVKALKKYAKCSNWQDIELGDEEYFAAQFKNKGYETAQKALIKIEQLERIKK